MAFTAYTDDITTFSLRWWLQRGRNFFWVAIITILIWVYADMEFTDTMEMKAKVLLNTEGAPELQLMSDSSIDANVTFRVQGNRSSLEGFRTQMAKLDVLSFDVSGNYEPGIHTVSLRDMLNSSPLIGKMGLSVLSAVPERITFHLDRLVKVENVPVQLEMPGVVLSEVKIEPSAVTLYVPQSQLKMLPGKDNLAIKTRIDLKNAPAKGEFVDSSAEIIPVIENVPVTSEPATVRVTVKIAQRTDNTTLTVPVFVMAPPEWYTDGTWQQYELISKDHSPMQEWRKSITVMGPKKDIDRLKPESVQAFVQLTDDDKKPVASWLSREVIVRFPPDMDLKVVGEKPVVNFKIVRRTAATPAPS